ncbi:MAG: mechanosensitive ion channel family protein [Kiritimatiellia bacterium]|jgi:small conductance mechanosensitive channel
MEALVVKIQEWFALFGLRVLAAVAILGIGRYVAVGVRSFLRKALTRTRIDRTLISFVSSLAYVGVIIFVVIAALGQLGVETASIIAVLGAAGLAVGLALQGSLSNFAAGVLILVFKPFKVGDYIEAGGTAGTVDEIGILTIELKTPDGRLVVVPNSKAMGDCIVNYTATGRRRLDVTVSVDYEEDLTRVLRLLQTILDEEPRLLPEPAPRLGVLELGEHGVVVAARPWVKSSEYWDVRFDMLEKIKHRLDDEKIRIPFNQLDVHVRSGAGGVDGGA